MGQIDNTAISPDLSELSMLVGKLRLVGEPRAVMPAPRNLLRAAKVDVDCVAAVLHVLGGFQQDLRVVPGKLDHEWSVFADAVQRPKNRLPIRRRVSELTR